MSFRNLFGSGKAACCASLVALLLGMTITCRKGGDGPPAQPGPGELCPALYFEGIGDLPNDAYDSAVSDISADGVRAVGESWTDDPGVAGDGSVGWPHGYEGIGWTRPCEHKPFYMSIRGFVTTKMGTPTGGLVALGYWLPSVHPESNGYGISPDGRAIVGFATVGDNYAEATMFGFGSVQRIGKLPGDVASAAFDVSDGNPIAPNGRAWWARWAGSWMDRPVPRPRVIVGWSSTSNQHPARAAGGHAVYWDAFYAPIALPLPTKLPNGRSIVSAEATTVSNNGAYIAGNLFFDSGSGGYLYNAYAITWAFKNGGYEIKAILSGPLTGADQDCRASRISGDGHIVVGYFVTSTGETNACSWDTNGGVPHVLPLLANTANAAAYGVNKDGTVIVGFCGNYTDTAPYFDHKATIWKSGAGVSDLAALLSGATPPVNVPANWELECRAVSDSGNIIGGWGYRPDPLDPSNPEAFTEEGWVAKIP